MPIIELNGNSLAVKKDATKVKLTLYIDITMAKRLEAMRKAKGASSIQELIRMTTAAMLNDSGF